MKKNYYQRKIIGIYLIQHRETLRSYCGQSRDVLHRWKSHCSGGKKAVGIGAAIRDYGVDSFTFRVLEECDVSQLNDQEVWWIQHYDCVEPQGYNRNSGGGAPTFVSEKTREKMSEAGKGKTLPEETKAKMSAAHKGKTHSEESKEKMSAALKGKITSDETKAKLSAAGKGVPKSEETRTKMSEATKESWRKRKESAEACKESDGAV
jgi:group I intron endonuclease